ncbi:MAG: sensor histidine kinase [Chitinophagaceae bacterium]
MSKNKNYWLCQLLGWFGMVTIEITNYTFFIIGKFNPDIFLAMLEFAVYGIAITHLYRYYLKRTNFFQKKTLRIWASALLSTILLASLITFASYIPEIFKSGFVVFKQLSFIQVSGSIVNWMRYVGVWVIIYFMYKLLQQNSAIQQEKMSIENLARTTELELLKSQLNPHFLFNALNSIKALVLINPEQCREAIVKLSELLRFTLQYGKEKEIALKDELKEVKKYLELEQLRFGERLSVLFNIDEDALSCNLPPAIILCLAENAVKHGVSKQIMNSVVILSTSVVNNFLLIQISNTGSYKPESESGIGLKHITKRLYEIYHNQAIFEINNANETVVATVKIPLQWQ